MTAKIVNGNVIARTIRAGYKSRIERLVLEAGCITSLAVILVGNDPASMLYVANKVRACESARARALTYTLPVSVDTVKLVEHIESLNHERNVHGILVQLPLPPHIDMRRVLEAISVDKDVDGFHLYNVGGLLVGATVFSPCTPFGVIHQAARIRGHCDRRLECRCGRGK